MNIGDRYGKLTVTSESFKDGHYKKVSVKCDCGIEKSIHVDHLKSGATKSCGCLHREKLSLRNTKHGGCGTRLYRIWKSIHERCRDKKSKYYGGRGLTICEAWSKFEAFRDWALRNGYDDALSIDRIDTNGNYYPKNCRWATHVVQSQNKRKHSTNTSGYIGVSRQGNRWKAYASLGCHIHLGYFDTAIEAAQARDKYVSAHYESPTLNFPEGQLK